MAGVAKMPHMRERQRRTLWVPTNVAKMHVTSDFERALYTLFPSRRHDEILAFFDRQVSWSAIKHWKKGRAQPPAWVVGRLQDAARKAADAILAPAAGLVPGAGHNGAYGARHWREYHARRKEKARDKAGQEET